MNPHKATVLWGFCFRESPCNPLYQSPIMFVAIYLPALYKFSKIPF